MGSFEEALIEFKKEKPDWQRAVDNILTDRRGKENPYGVSDDLHQSADQMVGNGTRIPEAVAAHHFLKKPKCHVEAQLGADNVFRVVSGHAFVRWHCGDGGFSSAAEHATLDWLKDFFDGIDDADSPVIFEGDCEATKLQGVTGKKNDAVWWGWDEDRPSEDKPSPGASDKDDHRFQGEGKRYMGLLALSENEFEHAEKDGVVVEVRIAGERYPKGKPFYRPTGFDSFIPDTRFCPNTGRGEKYGRTCPVGPAEGEDGFPEVVAEAFGYADELDADDCVEVRIFRY